MTQEPTETTEFTEFTGLTKERKSEIEHLTQPGGLKPVNPLNYGAEIMKCIDKIKVSDDAIYIKLNKNLILHTENSVSICDNLNIQIAGQIHLNPVVKMFKAIQSKFKRLSNELADIG